MPEIITKTILALVLLFCLFVIGAPVYAEGNNANEVTPYGEHFRLITDVDSIPMHIEVFDQQSGQFHDKTVLGSDFIRVSSDDYIQIICNPQLGSSFPDQGEFYIYFYDQARNVIWDILDHTDTNTGERNRVSVRFLKELNGFQFTNIPDGYYVRIACVDNYNCQLLIWDGCKTGYPITGLTTVFHDDLKKERLPSDGSACLQVPESALYLIAKPEYTFLNMVASDTQSSETVKSSDLRFPSQVICLRESISDRRAKNIRIVKDYDYYTGEYSNVMPNTDLSDAVTAVDEGIFRSTVPASSFLGPVYRNIEACMDFQWEAKAEIVDTWGSTGNNGITGSFRKGVSYHGIPYRSSWFSASSVGWHVSKQTFMNAANDPDSIFYNTPSSERVGPYYSLVCSSFATLVSGFSYPMTNFSLMKDPQILVENTSQPAIGSLMTNGYGHCFIPIDRSVDSNVNTIFTISEQIGPLTAIRNIYPSIQDSWKGIGVVSSYPSEYTYKVTPPGFSSIPYDITSYTIKNGSARPHRGDQSVYTSAMDVLINIKDPEATRLYFQRFDVSCSHGLPTSISPFGVRYYVEIAPGTRQVVLRSATAENNTFSGAPLENGGIYGVWASRGALQNTAPTNVEFFEWYDLATEEISYQIKEGTLVTDDVFWYAVVSASNENDYIKESTKSGLLTIPYQAPIRQGDEVESHSDYSNYAERAIITSNSVSAFFNKGVFGAYVTGANLLGD